MSNAWSIGNAARAACERGNTNAHTEHLNIQLQTFQGLQQEQAHDVEILGGGGDEVPSPNSQQLPKSPSHNTPTIQRTRVHTTTTPPIFKALAQLHSGSTVLLVATGTDIVAVSWE